ncbi:2Fe-2S iron-sulfur cluster binding domain-containing protein [Ferrimicrobium acidiphilum]|uniref:2Fe-2S iron-sulfur cluster binding domain-containing protein n=1 Tax=Ferrimicrobium acidiphilum TaxID=121039 RepID=UPI0023F593BB|nr:2Fe-2S iron-sulfur cluster binding domain-containing protein [Ferrimicrobium acidiphilum]
MSVIRLYPSGNEVPCPDGMTVLAALEAEGWALPNNCRAGTCGECKVKVRSGSFDQGFVLDMALSKEDREQGYGAMCMAKPLSEYLEIEWGTEDAKPTLFPPREQIAYVVVERIERTPSIIELRLRPIGESLRFWPGQHMQLGAPPEHPLRNYSMANAPRPDGELTFYITREPFGQTSSWLTDSVAIGETLMVNGPYGSFIGDPAIATPVLLLAGGSGLAPIMSLTEAALRRGFAHPVTLVFSVRTPADVYPLGQLEYLKRRYPNFELQVSYTRHDHDKTCTAEPHHHGRIPEILETITPSLAGTAVFIAGNDHFVSDCARVVNSLGPGMVYTEPFTDQQGDFFSLSILG